MNFIDALFEGAEGVWSGGAAHILIIISVVIALGRLFGKIKIFGVSFGVTWVLFIGILFGHFGLTLDSNLLHFLKEFGLVIFVYSIGLQIGPGFFHSFKSGGLGFNLLAVIVVFIGVCITVLFYCLTDMPITTVVGVMSGAVTNTPGLGAAQQAFFDISGKSAPDIALGYAVAYPLGVIGCIVTFVIIKKMFYHTSPSVKKKLPSAHKAEKKVRLSDHPNLIPIFFGIALGCLLGSIPFRFPGIPQPVKLGLAGGPLIASILMSYLAPKLKFITYTTVSANLMLREIGISIFLTCVGLEAGDHFIETLINGGGIRWIAYGVVITVVPVLAGGFIGRYLFKMDYNTLIGILAGACTDPPALSYANELDDKNEDASLGYATVYPLTMFLRVLVAQLLILVFV